MANLGHRSTCTFYQRKTHDYYFGLGWVPHHAFLSFSRVRKRFPNVSAKGRGYQIRAMTEGPEGWEELRKVSVWQTTAALQQEMEAKMIKAREKSDTRGDRATRSNIASVGLYNRFWYTRILLPLPTSYTVVVVRLRTLFVRCTTGRLAHLPPPCLSHRPSPHIHHLRTLSVRGPLPPSTLRNGRTHRRMFHNESRPEKKKARRRGRVRVSLRGGGKRARNMPRRLAR